MLVYTPNITSRFRYACDFIGHELAGRPFELTADLQQFSNYSGPKINYSDSRKISGEFWIVPNALLFENDIKTQPVAITDYKGQRIFFKTGGDHPFDIFAAVFYLLSRYEEYLPHQKDEYGRYAHTNALAFREGFLAIPMINHWLKEFGQQLKNKFPFFTTQPAGFRFIPTYDIDEAFSFRHKAWWRNAGGAARDLLKGNWKQFLLRREVRAGKAQDPFDAYAWMDQLHERYKLSPRYFFLLAQRNGRYDHNLSPGTQALQKIVKEHDKIYTIGIHPSWQSGDDPSLLGKEIATLSGITGKPVRQSRQHYIRFHFPGTFRQLIEAGITDDYSMGYGSINGFRASVASPFYWYDLEKNESTSLRLWPFCYMEANSFFEQKQTPAEALQEMKYYYNAVKQIEGTLISIWHNTFLGTAALFKGWSEVYADFISQLH